MKHTKPWVRTAMIFLSFTLALLTFSPFTTFGAEGSVTLAALSGKITAGGATAMQPLVEQAAKIFMDKNPGVSISVQGGGSGTGLSQVAAGAFDIGNSDIFAEEKLKPEQYKNLVDHQIAVVGMAAVANPNVGVDNVTKQQLIDIFTGKITNWKELGGKDVKIQLVNRPSSSGTRATFKKYALDGAEEASGIEEDSSGTVRKIVAETPGAIGYLAFSYLDGSVKALKIDGVAPTKENVVTNRYKVWAYEHSYTKGEPTGVVAAFIDFMMNDPAVQGPGGVVEKAGYIPTADMEVIRDVNGNVKPFVKFTVGNKTYTVGGNKKTIDGPAPFIEANRTMVPLKYVAEALDAKVDYDAKTKKITVTKGTTTIVMYLGEKAMKINGSSRAFDTPVRAVDGRTVLPIAQIANALGVKYKWDDQTKTVRFW
ncbi:MAG: phosphate ABC transporter substrate-binding protein PstS family protein [Candidatus Carbobacillus altaicus]|nr:phosphate ABC transporter substrate-binding protein PstS family protein [Candidatus Carbobacillus altaicus]